LILLAAATACCGSDSELHSSKTASSIRITGKAGLESPMEFVMEKYKRRIAINKIEIIRIKRRNCFE
jgi:hypothetical protein